MLDQLDAAQRPFWQLRQEGLGEVRQLGARNGHPWTPGRLGEVGGGRWEGRGGGGRWGRWGERGRWGEVGEVGEVGGGGGRWGEVGGGGGDGTVAESTHVECSKSHFLLDDLRLS